MSCLYYWVAVTHDLLALCLPGRAALGFQNPFESSSSLALLQGSNGGRSDENQLMLLPKPLIENLSPSSPLDHRSGWGEFLDVTRSDGGRRLRAALRGIPAPQSLRASCALWRTSSIVSSGSRSAGSKSRQSEEMCGDHRPPYISHMRAKNSPASVPDVSGKTSPCSPRYKGQRRVSQPSLTSRYRSRASSPWKDP